MNMPTIVVGVDGSPASHAAVRLAIDEAALRGCHVKIVTCWSAWTRQLALRPDRLENDTYEIALAVAQEAVDEVAASAQERSMMFTECGEDDPGPALVRASHDAVLLVVGSTSRGTVARHLGRTTVDHCLNHSGIPVVVVPFATVTPEDTDARVELLESAQPS